MTRGIYLATREGSAFRDFRYIDQIRAASFSIMSNTAEGFGRDRNAEFKQFLHIAKASAGEVRSQLYVALDVGYLTEADFRRLVAVAFEGSA